LQPQTVAKGFYRYIRDFKDDKAIAATLSVGNWPHDEMGRAVFM
jgi:hypothetical protein